MKFLEKIFSIKNDGYHKVWTILGISFKAKIKNKKIIYDLTCKIDNLTHLVHFDISNERKIQKMLSDSLINKYKKQMVDLKLFDEEFYKKNYPEYKKYGLSAIDHYIKIGWQMYYNPSEIFNTKFYLSQTVTMQECPLIDFLKEGRYRALYAYTDNIPTVLPEQVEKKIKNKRVIYTCIVGEYDDLKQQTYIADGFDYVCFSDNQDWLKQGQIGIWQIRPLVMDNLDPTRINRYHKINPHIVLPEYEDSIYIDSNINILTPFLFDLIEARKSKLLLPQHFSTLCAYVHADWILRDKVDYPELVTNFLNLMKENNFPANYGMTENNIIYRKHNEPEIIKLMEEWWSYIRDYCKRDQLSFSYALWKNDIQIKDISFLNARSDIENFMLIAHKKRRADVE